MKPSKYDTVDHRTKGEQMARADLLRQAGERLRAAADNCNMEAVRIEREYGISHPCFLCGRRGCDGH